MAVWQFKFSLIPPESLTLVYGTCPTVLDEYRASPKGPQFRDRAEFTNYWGNGSTLRQMTLVISGFLAEIESWSSEARMFGDPDGNKIEVWADEITCFVDMRHFSGAFVRHVLALAQQFRVKLLVHGSGAIIAPTMSALTPEIDGSDAYRFCVSPEDYIKSIQSPTG